MTDTGEPDGPVEQRLRADARQWADEPVPAPDLGADLRGATSRRLRPPGWLAIAASIVLVAALAVGLAAHNGGGSDIPSGGSGTALPRPFPSDVPSTRGDERLFYFDDVGFSGAILGAGGSDADRIGVVVPYSTQPGDCSVFAPTLAVIEQGGVVRLRVSGFQYLPRSAAQGGHIGTSCVGGGTRTLSARLARPLGRRTVVDALNPRRRVVLADPADFPTAHYLPTGYRQTSAQPVSAAAGRTVAQRVYRRGGDMLVLQIGDRTTLDLGGHVLLRTTVAGRAAVVTGEPHDNCVRWPERSGRIRLLCSESAALSSGVLLRVARSIR